MNVMAFKRTWKSLYMLFFLFEILIIESISFEFSHVRSSLLYEEQEHKGGREPGLLQSKMP